MSEIVYYQARAVAEQEKLRCGKLTQTFRVVRDRTKRRDGSVSFTEVTGGLPSFELAKRKAGEWNRANPV